MSEKEFTSLKNAFAIIAQFLGRTYAMRIVADLWDRRLLPQPRLEELNNVIRGDAA